MSELSFLKSFLEAKRIAPGEEQELRGYLRDRAEPIAEALGATPERLLEAIELHDDDGVLIRKLLASIKQRRETLRAERSETRELSAQQAADVLASTAEHRWDWLCFNLPALLARCITHPDDFLIVQAPGIDLAIPMRTLLKLRALKRRDLRGYFTAKGLHVRWGSGGLNLRGYDMTQHERRECGRVVFAVAVPEIATPEASEPIAAVA